MDPLRKRAAWLLRRGFDVPPSKEAEYRELRESGLTMEEAREVLRLE